MARTLEVLYDVSVHEENVPLTTPGCMEIYHDKTVSLLLYKSIIFYTRLNGYN